MTNDALLHPIRAVKLAFRRMILRSDLRSPELPSELPPELQRFEVGESLPWKGVMFKVGRIVGGDWPVIILIPAGRTRGATLKGLRNFRDEGRAHLKRGADVRKALAAETRG